ncbi:MAG: CRISPR-associated helicase Cas3' [Candidatus Thorarchaeota archaeon]|nr:CRISPR-associated helicase Cas3' [Candidatus Thorarchaeota archaeon]
MSEPLESRFLVANVKIEYPDEDDAGFSVGNTGEYSVERDLPRSPIADGIIDKFRDLQMKKGIWQPPTNDREKRIKKLREDTYQRTNDTLASDNNIVSLQAPTGSGKTLAMLSYAVRLREKIKKEKGFAPRIIYALPFISIAEQVENIVRDIFDIRHKENDALLTVHHSLSELNWHSQGDEYDPKNIRFFIDRWRSDIIITTTVRLCETILGPSKRDSIRFNRLAGSIILMDEVQSFPVKYWDIIGETIKALANNLGCHMLIATATMPAIIRPDEMYSTSVDGGGVNRYEVQYQSKRISLDEFTQEVIAELRDKPSSNVLVVLNTKAAAASAYSEIQKAIDSEDELYFLSGWVAPIHRKQTINQLRISLKSGKRRVILVCTQVIEAGVDVSFDIAFRDLAPLDSIIQVAGRCNRSWEKEKLGIVKVRCVFNSESKRGYAQSVYDEIDLEMTREVLQERDGESYDEEKLRERLSLYFSEIRKRKITNVALKHAICLEWDDLGKTFNLIDRVDTSCKVLIQCDGRSESILDGIRDKLKEKRVWIPSAFYRYTIELSKKQYDALEFEVESVWDHNGHLLFGVIGTEPDTKLYSSDTGFKVPEN